MTPCRVANQELVSASIRKFSDSALRIATLPDQQFSFAL
jgi:hypothetical protein